jgi:hypothetical protein
MQLISGYIKEAKDDFQFKAKHKNPEGGLSEAGRKAYNRETGGNLKRPQPEGGSRRDSFCARMKGMKAKLTSAETARDPDSRINKSLRKWKCSYDMSEVKEAASKALSARMSMLYPDDDFTPESYALAVDSQRILNPGVIIGTTEDYQDFLDDDAYINKLLKIPGVREALEAKQKQSQKEAAVKRKGLWANIHAKRERGEAPAKPGDADFPDAKNWKKVTKESEKEAAGRCWKGYEPVPGMKAKTKGSCRPISAGKKESVKKADEEEMANKLMNIQQFMGQNPRRELSEEEAKKVEERKRALIPALFPNYSDSPAEKIYSPLLPALGVGLGGAAAGGLLGGLISKEIGPRKSSPGLGVAAGALGGGGLFALLSYLQRKQENANIEEIMRRLPRGATLRDYEADPLIQKNLDRNAQMAMMAAMMAR